MKYIETIALVVLFFFAIYGVYSVKDDIYLLEDALTKVVQKINVLECQKQAHVICIYSPTDQFECIDRLLAECEL